MPREPTMREIVLGWFNAALESRATRMSPTCITGAIVASTKSLTEAIEWHRLIGELLRVVAEQEGADIPAERVSAAGLAKCGDAS